MVFITQATYKGVKKEVQSLQGVEDYKSYVVRLDISFEGTSLTGVSLRIKVRPFVNNRWAEQVIYSDGDILDDWRFPTDEDGLSFAQRWIAGVDADLELSKDHERLSQEHKALQTMYTDLKGEFDKLTRDSNTDHANMDIITEDLNLRVQAAEKQLVEAQDKLKSLMTEHEKTLQTLEAVTKQVVNLEATNAWMKDVVTSEAEYRDGMLHMNESLVETVHRMTGVLEKALSPNQ